MTKLAIISTYNNTCGIAGYTRALVPKLRPFFKELEVFDLDQYILRSKNKAIINAANQHINEICCKLKNFDCVNIQLEHGTLGITTEQISSRLKKIINSSKRVTITFHTIIDADDEIPKTANPLKIIRSIIKYSNYRKLGPRLYRFIKQAQSNKKISIITHTARDEKIFRCKFQLSNVYCHPLSFIDEAEHYKLALLDSFIEINGTRSNKTLGLFGFISPYKGIEIAINALRLLPDEYNISIFGGLHPNEIKKNIKINEYLNNLIKTITTTDLELSIKNTSKLVKFRNENIRTMLDKDLKKSLVNRVKFMGALSDKEFAQQMAKCYAVILPYEEVGQSSSGPMSIANEVGATIFASRTKTFIEYKKFHVDRAIHLFDQGNFLELATLIESVQIEKKSYPNSYNSISNVETYLKALNG